MIDMNEELRHLFAQERRAIDDELAGEQEKVAVMEKGFERRLQMMRSRLIVVLSQIDYGKSAHLLHDAAIDEIINALSQKISQHLKDGVTLPHSASNMVESLSYCSRESLHDHTIATSLEVTGKKRPNRHNSSSLSKPVHNKSSQRNRSQVYKVLQPKIVSMVESPQPRQLPEEPRGVPPRPSTTCGLRFASPPQKVYNTSVSSMIENFNREKSQFNDKITSLRHKFKPK